MNTKSKFKFYLLNLFGLISLFCVLLPWMSYGVGSKTGLDIGRVTLAIITLASILFLIFTQIHYRAQKFNRFLLAMSTVFSFTVFFTYLFEIVRVTYLTTVAKNLPVEMFGVASMATAQIHIGYGLWLGVATSFLMSTVQFFSYKREREKTTSHL